MVAHARPDVTPDWLTKREAAAWTRCDERTINRYIAAGKLPAYRLGNRSIRIKREDLEALLTPVPAAA